MPTRAPCAAMALLAMTLVAIAPRVYATDVTMDLIQDCQMPSASVTLCVFNNPDLPLDADQLWIDFTLGGVPMAHLVTANDALWAFSFTFNPNPSINAAIGVPPPILELTDMGGVIGGLAPSCNIASPFSVGCQVLVPGGTFVHDVHLTAIPLEPGVPGIALSGLSIGTTLASSPTAPIPEPHIKGVWVTEPGSLALLVMGGLLVVAAGVHRASS